MIVAKGRLRGDNDIMKKYCEYGYSRCRICKQWFWYDVWVSKYDHKMPDICENCESLMKKQKENIN